MKQAVGTQIAELDCRVGSEERETMLSASVRASLRLLQSKSLTLNSFSKVMICLESEETDGYYDHCNFRNW